MLESGSGPPSYWAHVKAQLHLDGADGSTTITDTGPLATVFASAGSAALRTAGGIWGTAALEPGAAGSANAANTAFVIGLNVPFTIRFWVRKASGLWTGSEKAVCGVWGAASPDLGWLITINATGRPTFYWSPNGSGANFPVGPASLPNDTSKHMVSISRTAAGALLAHIDGVYGAPTGSVPGTAEIANPAGAMFRVGASGGAGTFPNAFGADRYIDELEVIIGECLYAASDYTVPTSPFPTY